MIPLRIFDEITNGNFLYIACEAQLQKHLLEESSISYLNALSILDDMVDFIFSPNWFYGKDIIIDLVSAFVLFLIAFFSIKNYRLNKENKNHLALAASFNLIGLSFLFKIITNFTIYYKVLETQQFGLMTLTRTIITSSNVLYFGGFLISRSLMLLGLYMLYVIYKKQPKESFFLTVFLLLALIYFSRASCFIFHITSLALLLFITFHYLGNYRKNKHYGAKWLFFSFLAIALSQLIFIFQMPKSVIYVIGEVIQLVGYIGLLITFTRVLKDGKKTRKK